LEFAKRGITYVTQLVGAVVDRNCGRAMMNLIKRHTFRTADLAPALYHYQVHGPSGILGAGKLTIVR
jgi:hypothetical protein